MVTTGVGNMSIASIPNSWVTGGAWEKTFRHWKKQQDEAVAAAGAQSSVAKFRDFKIHMNVEHMTAGFAGNMLPYDSDSNVADVGEWEASKIVVPNILPDGTGSNIEPTEYFLHMCGVNNNAGVSRGVIDGYGASRAYPHSPDPVGPDMASSANYLQQMTDVGNDTPEILDRATDINDDLPYDQDEYPGGEGNMPGLEIQQAVTFSPTTVSGKAVVPGGCYPCGLIRFEYVTNAAITLVIHLLPGEHRGYMATKMEDFN